MFYAHVVHIYFGTKKLQSEHFSFVIFGAKILKRKCVRKTLMKLTSGRVRMGDVKFCYARLY